MCGFFQDYRGLNLGALALLPFSPPHPCRFSPPSQARFGPLYRSLFGSHFATTEASEARLADEFFQIALQIGHATFGELDNERVRIRRGAPTRNGFLTMVLRTARRLIG